MCSTEGDRKEGHESVEFPLRLQWVHDNIHKGHGGLVWDLCHGFLVLAGRSGHELEEVIDVLVWHGGSGVEGRDVLGGRNDREQVLARGSRYWWGFI